MNVSIGKLFSSDAALAVFDTSVTAQGLVRPLDSWGDVQKFIIDGPVSCDDTTGIPTILTATATGTSPITSSIVSGESLLVTTGSTEYDGVNLQAKGSMFQCTSEKPWYFGAKLAVSDATQSDLLLGMCGIDTTLLAASSAHAIAVGAGGAFFSKLDAVTAGYVKTYQTSSENNSAAAFTLDTSAHIYELIWDGAAIRAYVDDELIATFTATLPTVVLTPSIAYRTGAAAAKTLNLHWMRAFQVRS